MIKRAVISGTLIMLGAMTACGSTEDTGGETAPLECGDEVYQDLSLAVMVVGDGSPLEGVDVQLVEENWEPGVKGAGVTGVDGIATFDASVLDIPNCWNRLSYSISATDPVGVWGDADKQANSYLFNAITDGTMTVEILDFPIEME